MSADRLDVATLARNSPAFLGVLGMLALLCRRIIEDLEMIGIAILAGLFVYGRASSAAPRRAVTTLFTIRPRPRPRVGPPLYQAGRIGAKHLAGPGGWAGGEIEDLPDGMASEWP